MARQKIPTQHPYKAANKKPPVSTRFLSSIQDPVSYSTFVDCLFSPYPLVPVLGTYVGILFPLRHGSTNLFCQKLRLL
jgi:hypothetical protein